MPFYDYIYGTVDKSTDSLYETSLQKPEESPDVVHLTHLTTPQSIYHIRLGFASFASRPLTSKWYLWLMWPVILCSMIIARICGRTFVVERNTFHKLKLQSWVVPRYTLHVRKKVTVFILPIEMTRLITYYFLIFFYYFLLLVCFKITTRRYEQID